MFKEYQPFTFRALLIYLLEEVFQKNWKRYRKVKGQRGVSLYLTIIIMVILLAVVLGLSAILLSQLKMVKEMENSVIAFYAADTGIERILYEDKLCRQVPPCLAPCKNDSDGDGFCDGVPTNYDTGEVSLGNQATYNAKAITNGFKSVGTFKGTKRAIEITWF